MNKRAVVQHKYQLAPVYTVFLLTEAQRQVPTHGPFHDVAC